MNQDSQCVASEKSGELASLITPDEITRHPVLRMPTFEEFLLLYVKHNGRIHEVINKFTIGLQQSFRLKPELIEKLKRAGYSGSDLVMAAPSLDYSGDGFEFAGDVVTFNPPGQDLSYFVVSHCFDSVTVQEKLLQRSSQTPYMFRGIFAT